MGKNQPINHQEIEKTQKNAPVVTPAMVEAMAKAAKNKETVQGSIDRHIVQPRLPAGSWIAVVTDATLERQQPSIYGINDRIKVQFSVCVNQEEPVEYTVSYWKSSTENSLYVRNLGVLLDSDPRSGFNLSELIGRTCQLDIVHNTTKRGTYANIGEIRLIQLNASSTVSF